MTLRDNIVKRLKTGAREGWEDARGVQPYLAPVTTLASMVPEVGPLLSEAIEVAGTTVAGSYGTLRGMARPVDVDGDGVADVLVRRGGPSVGGTNSSRLQLLLMKRMRTSKIRPEIKTIDDQIVAGVAASDTVFIQSIGLSAEGSGIWNRLGRRTNLKSLYFHGYLRGNTTAPANPSGFRVVILYDKQANGATPTFSTVFAPRDSAGSSSVTTDPSLLQINQDYKDRFEILYDKWGYLGKPTLAGGSADIVTAPGPGELYCRGFIKLKRRSQMYNNTTAAVGSINQGNLVIMAWSNLTVAQFAPKLDMCLRTKFEDI